MPRSSISADHIDRILAPSQIASELAAIGRQLERPNLRTLEDGNEQPGEAQHVARILAMLPGRLGH